MGRTPSTTLYLPTTCDTLGLRLPQPPGELSSEAIGRFSGSFLSRQTPPCPEPSPPGLQKAPLEFYTSGFTFIKTGLAFIKWV